METEGKEKESVITVRLPKALHDSLVRIACHEGTSLNRLCVVTLANYAEDLKRDQPH